MIYTRVAEMHKKAGRLGSLLSKASQKYGKHPKLYTLLALLTARTLLPNQVRAGSRWVFQPVLQGVGQATASGMTAPIQQLTSGMDNMVGHLARKSKDFQQTIQAIVDPTLKKGQQTAARLGSAVARPIERALPYAGGALVGAGLGGLAANYLTSNFLTGKHNRILRLLLNTIGTGTGALAGYVGTKSFMQPGKLQEFGQKILNA